MKALFIFTVLAVAIMIQYGIAGEDCASKVTCQTICPVTGGEIDKDVYKDCCGKRIYFCSQDCVSKFEKNPESYMKKLNTDGVVLEDASTAQTKCPVMGGEIDKSIFVDYDGKRVYFCCAGCKDTFNEDPKKYVDQLEAEGVTLESVSKSPCEKEKKKCGGCPFGRKKS